MNWYLDFGHGGKDCGAVGGNGTRESNVVLKVGLMVKDMLCEAFENVVTTRENDVYYSLSHRANKANDTGCDYFVSIHMNASESSSSRGCEVWVYDEGSKVYGLARDLCLGLSSSLGTLNRGVKVSKKFAVLKNTKMPSLLIEVDFISNEGVEQSCADDKYLKAVASSIASTLLSFVSKEIVEDGPFYRVCIGAFRDRSNADKVRSEAISKGFVDSYII